ncbi:MAG: hypothetical protein JW757_05475 [Anaerolineales bacterium]|nr:hypothetical protein [Anaerolineales bacterium]
MSTLTIFTAPKPFVDAHITIIQRNALRSWQMLGADVDVILYGNDSGIGEAAAEFGFGHVPDVAANQQGVPYLNDMLARTRALSASPVLAVVNTDILLFQNFAENARLALETLGDFMLVGRRWDLDITEELDFDPQIESRLKMDTQTRGQLKSPTASDYFIFSRTVLNEIPNFTIGRAGWDSWMIYHALQQPWPVLDATREIFIVHQNHDYSHLPNGQPHYRHPESERNVALGGGDRNMYDQTDLRLSWMGGKVVPKPLTWYRLIRSLEHRLHPGEKPGRIRGRLFGMVKNYRQGLRYD